MSSFISRGLVLPLTLAVLCGLASCATQKHVLYLQDIQPGDTTLIDNARSIRLQPKDQISILISSKDNELAAPFNLTRAQYRAGYATLSSASYNGEVSGFTLDDEGYVDYPILGRIYLGGMTKSEVAMYIKDRLLEEKLLKDPIVTVEFMNLYFSVLGEVTKPGKYSITKDQVTILEALSMAGDLTIYGVRDGVYVVREEDGQRITYQVDMRSKNLFDSPAYYLKQNDVVYVEPNQVKTQNSRIGTVTTTMLSATSLLMTLATLILNVLKFTK